MNEEQIHESAWMETITLLIKRIKELRAEIEFLKEELAKAKQNVNG